MNKRPLSVTIISWIFIAAGVIGLAYHSTDFAKRPFHYDVVWVSLLRLAAILCGVFMLRGSNWARWLALAWLAYHVVIGAMHSTTELLMHAVLLAVFSFFLLRPPAAAYFRAGRTEAA
jgi:hypothetical protein